MNKKIAEFAGFTRSGNKREYHWNEGVREQHWLDPDGTITWGTYGIRGRLPDFERSMDACEKWVIPKLDYVEIKYSPGKLCPSVKVESNGLIRYGQDKTIPQAFCRAVEKLIEETP